tara:strand:+ start:108 stop:770 length:663 start_codon:yes stop_codon:yes gene_type:complete
MEIKEYNLEDLPTSSFNIVIAKRRGGKSYLVSYIIDELRKQNKVDMVFLFSPTDAGFNQIHKDFRFSTIDVLENIVENFRLMNEYNKVVNKPKQIKLRAVIILDDLAVDLKKMDILDRMATNGRHYAYEPLSLSFFILSQSLMKLSRTTRLNTDTIIHNLIASTKELQHILDENYYLDQKEGKQIYYDTLKDNDFGFILIANYKQNIKNFSDYIFSIKAK